MRYNELYMTIISNIQFASEDIYMMKEYMAIFLIILLSISFLLEGTKYWNTYVSDIIVTSSNPLILVLVAIIIFKIIDIIK